MANKLFLDSFFNPPSSNPEEEELPAGIEALQSALRLSPLKQSALKNFIRKEAAKLEISPENPARVFDPDSLESLRQNIFLLLKILKKDATTETTDTFLHRYSFFSDWEEFKGFLLVCFGGRIEQKDHLFRALYQKTKATEATLKELLHPQSTRDPIRIQIEQWLGQFQKKTLKMETFHPESVSPLTIVEHFYQHDQQKVKEETALYLKSYHRSQIRKKQAQLIQSGADQTTLQQEMIKYQQDLQNKKKEHYFTYGEITKIRMLKNNLTIELEKLLEYLSRSFILALPDEIFSAKDKEILERSTHDGFFEAVGQTNNLKRHPRLIEEYQQLSNPALIKRLLEYQENAAVLQHRDHPENLIRALAKASKMTVSPEQIARQTKTTLKSLLMRLAKNSLRLRTFRYSLDQFMKRHEDKPLFPEGKAYDYGGIAYGLTKVVLDHLFNPYNELYYMIQKVVVLDWCVYQLAEQDRQAGTCERSAIKADIYQAHGLAIFDKNNDRKDDFFYNALRDKNRCHLTGTRNLEMISLEQLPELQWHSIFEDIRERIFSFSEQAGTLNPAILCFGMQEEMLRLFRELANLNRSRESANTWKTHPQQQNFPSLSESLTEAVAVLEQQRAFQRTRRNLLEAKLAALQNPPAMVSEFGEIEESAREKYQKLPTIDAELPSFRDTPGNTVNRHAAPLVEEQEELEQRHFLWNNINYYLHFTEIAQLILEHYQEDVIHCDATYTHDDRFPGKLEFREKVVYLQSDEDHIIVIGKTFLSVDPTLPQQDLSPYVRFFVRGKLYPNTPRDRKKARLKMMSNLQSDQPLNAFEEIPLGFYRQIKGVNFKSLFKKAMLTVVQSLPEEKYQLPLVQTFLEYLIPSKKTDPPIGPKLRMRIKEAGLEEHLVIKGTRELLQDRVAPSISKIYGVLQKRNVPVFRGRKKRLDALKIPHLQQQIILKKIERDDKLRLYTMATVLDLYLTLKRRVPDFDENGLYAIAGHFYGFKPGELPDSLRTYLSAHLQFFKT